MNRRVRVCDIIKVRRSDPLVSHPSAHLEETRQLDPGGLQSAPSGPTGLQSKGRSVTVSQNPLGVMELMSSRGTRLSNAIDLAEQSVLKQFCADPWRKPGGL